MTKFVLQTSVKKFCSTLRDVFSEVTSLSRHLITKYQRGSSGVPLACGLYGDVRISKSSKCLPRQADVAEGVSGRLTLWRRNFLLNFSTPCI